MATTPDPAAELPTVFSDRELRDIVEAYRQAFGPWLDPSESFSVTASVVERHVELVVTLARADRSDVTRIEVASALGEKLLESVIDARARCVEFAAGWLEDYLRNDRLPGPHPNWKEYGFEGAIVLLRGSRANEDLEAQADAILAAAEAASRS